MMTPRPNPRCSRSRLLLSYRYVRLHESGDPAFDTYEEDFTTCVRARARALSFVSSPPRSRARSDVKTPTRPHSSSSFPSTRRDARYEFFTGLLTTALVLYCLYFGYLTVRAAPVLKGIEGGYLFLFALTLSVFLMTVIGLAVGYLYTIPTSSIEFLAYYGVFNLYVWMLAFAYAPASHWDDDVGSEAHMIEMGGGSSSSATPNANPASEGLDGQDDA